MVGWAQRRTGDAENLVPGLDLSLTGCAGQSLRRCRPPFFLLCGQGAGESVWSPPAPWFCDLEPSRVKQGLRRRVLERRCSSGRPRGRPGTQSGAWVDATFPLLDDDTGPRLTLLFKKTHTGPSLGSDVIFLPVLDPLAQLLLGQQLFLKEVPGGGISCHSGEAPELLFVTTGCHFPILPVLIQLPSVLLRVHRVPGVTRALATEVSHCPSPCLGEVSHLGSDALKLVRVCLRTRELRAASHFSKAW